MSLRSLFVLQMNKFLSICVWVCVCACPCFRSPQALSCQLPHLYSKSPTYWKEAEMDGAGMDTWMLGMIQTAVKETETGRDKSAGWDIRTPRRGELHCNRGNSFPEQLTVVMNIGGEGWGERWRGRMQEGGGGGPGNQILCCVLMGTVKAEEKRSARRPNTDIKVTNTQRHTQYLWIMLNVVLRLLQYK